MVTTAQLARLLNAATYHLWQRRMPGGLTSWRLLLPSADPCLRAHRAMWRYALHPRLPLPLAVLLEVLAWLRWVLLFAWVDTWQCWRNCRKYRLGPDDPGSWRDGLALLYLALLHGIHPWDSYCFGLYRPERRHLLWQYVYEHEHYHQWRSAGRKDWRAACELLADKVAWTAFMQEKALPVVPILAVLPAGSQPDFSRWLEDHPALFCKTRRGSRGEGAFVVERNPAGGFTARLHRPTTQQLQQPVDLARLLARQDYLVQPRMETDPALAHLSPAGHPLELRVITEHDGISARVACAVLYSATQAAPEDLDWLYFSVATSNGQLQAAPDYIVLPAWRKDYQKSLETAGRQVMPGWQSLCEAVTSAHCNILTGARNIAWDVLLTPTGPVILEGNSGWGMTMLQMVQGPFLSSSPNLEVAG